MPIYDEDKKLLQKTKPVMLSLLALKLILWGIFKI
ncbi:MAG: hypothetical protein JWR67_3949 [Mucilaginibacter sp.]|nr:hypothetical protein [Mucilaginibacter sp.]